MGPKLHIRFPRQATRSTRILERRSTQEMFKICFWQNNDLDTNLTVTLSNLGLVYMTTWKMSSWRRDKTMKKCFFLLSAVRSCRQILKTSRQKNCTSLATATWNYTEIYEILVVPDFPFCQEFHLTWQEWFWSQRFFKVTYMTPMILADRSDFHKMRYNSTDN